MAYGWTDANHKCVELYAAWATGQPVISSLFVCNQLYYLAACGPAPVISSEGVYPRTASPKPILHLALVLVP